MTNSCQESRGRTEGGPPCFWGLPSACYFAIAHFARVHANFMSPGGNEYVLVMIDIMSAAAGSAPAPVLAAPAPSAAPSLHRPPRLPPPLPSPRLNCLSFRSSRPCLYVRPHIPPRPPVAVFDAAAPAVLSLP